MTGPIIGSTIAGKYEIKKLLGQGGMGAVYEGLHLEIGKRVAIKVIEASHAGSEEIAARFRREARAASAVESDNIVQVFDIGKDPEIGLYMVMEFLTGEDLSGRLTRVTRLDTETAVTIGTQAARALAKAHAAGVVHRDLKPANIFLLEREDGGTHIKVLDFGISKLTAADDKRTNLQSDAPKALTRTGVVIGTPQYMSPEQAQGLPLDHRTDVWSLGAVLYEALAGVSAYPDMPTYEQTIIKIVLERPKPLSEIAPWVPAEIAAVVHAALTHDVGQRIADCGTFARQLTAALRASAHLPRPSLPEPSGPQHVIRAPSTGSIRPADGLSSTMQGPSVASKTQASTGPGVALGPKTLPRPLGPILAIAGVLALLVIVGVAVGLKRHFAAAPVITATAQGLVSSAVAPTSPVSPQAEPSSASTLLAPAVPPAAAPAIASSVAAAPALPPSTRHGAAPKTAGKPGANGASEPAPKTQFGAAGVSTAY